MTKDLKRYYIGNIFLPPSLVEGYSRGSFKKVEVEKARNRALKQRWLGTAAGALNGGRNGKSMI